MTPPFRGHDDAGTNVVGWGTFLGPVVRLLPLSPFVVVRLVSTVADALTPGTDT